MTCIDTVTVILREPAPCLADVEVLVHQPAPHFLYACSKAPMMLSCVQYSLAGRAEAHLMGPGKRESMGLHTIQNWLWPIQDPGLLLQDIVASDVDLLCFP